jgi:hypothetical protein
MSNTLTKKDTYTAGITVRSGGFTPVVTNRFEAGKDPIAANAEVVALKVPEGSILRHIIVDVKVPAAAGTLGIGRHVGGLNDTGVTTAPTAYSDQTPLDLTVAGKTLYSPTEAIVAANHFLVFKSSAAQAACVFEVTAVVDVFDLVAVTN